MRHRRRVRTTWRAIVATDTVNVDELENEGMGVAIRSGRLLLFLLDELE
jgi:hypothetical protein